MTPALLPFFSGGGNEAARDIGSIAFGGGVEAIFFGGSEIGFG